MPDTPQTDSPTLPLSRLANGRYLNFERRAVQPVGLYVTFDDTLRVDVYCETNPGPLLICARILLPNGQLSVVTRLQPLGAWTIRRLSVLQLLEGMLIDVSIFVDAALGSPVSAWVYAYLLRGAPGQQGLYTALGSCRLNAPITHLYPDAHFDVPTDGPGVPRVIVGSAPAAGANILETVPARVVWQLNSFHALLTASLAAGTRYPCLYLDDGANIFMRIGSLVNQAPNTVADYCAMIGGAFTAAVGPSIVNLPLPARVRLLPGWRIRTLIQGLDAADQFGAPIYQVDEWLLPF